MVPTNSSQLARREMSVQIKRNLINGEGEGRQKSWFRGSLELILMNAERNRGVMEDSWRDIELWKLVGGI